MEVIGLEPTTPCLQSSFTVRAEMSCLQGFCFQSVTANLLICVEICGFRVLSTATILTTLDARKVNAIRANEHLSAWDGERHEEKVNRSAF